MGQLTSMSLGKLIVELILAVIGEHIGKASVPFTIIIRRISYREVMLHGLFEPGIVNGLRKIGHAVEFAGHFCDGINEPGVYQACLLPAKALGLKRKEN